MKTIESWLAEDNPVAAEASRLWDEQEASFKDVVVVLDDDPTGTQAVHGVRVYTDWEQETLDRAFSRADRMFFILTNSRSFSAARTAEVHHDIAERIAVAAGRSGRRFIIVSRGDSTLRGHYPLEDEMLREGLNARGMAIDGEILCPAFFEGGRYTANDVHYLRQGESLVPVGETEFARDATFGYKSSNLVDWMVEKSDGNLSVEDCISVELEELRALDIDGITAKLMACHNFSKVIVNAVDYADLKVFATCLARACGEGRRFICRSAACLPKVLGRVSDKPLLTGGDVVDSGNANGGLVIVGSHVKLSTSQLEVLRNSMPDLHYVEFDIRPFVETGSLEEEAERITAICDKSVSSGVSTVVFTTRELVAPPDFSKEQKLALSVSISAGLTSVVSRLGARPRYLVSKGGITSSDVATKGLGIKEAVVLGQMAAGVPVWRAQEGSRFPGLPYLIFPGNVGTESTLRNVIRELEGQA